MRKRRALVLTSESAGHPFRRSLPPHVLVMPKHDAPAKSDDQDWKLFGLSFAAFFTAFYSFIA
ncbi:hypothetical protein C1T17_04060 [Sphingobium sp. SCG-1]|uniref:hypothetical protein n=1 Tax=Sphingobium sp. SCG-1 TaxID=2072936 RepID=UPI000CD6AA59|nr:hypothetical protein [Sphingobium sp. SCG-1]AUW57397.1 hypothetical protein C1T17_04060 [Sphingobium sp. SCG-1]